MMVRTKIVFFHGFIIVHPKRRISGHVENSRAFSRYRDIVGEMAKEVILKLE